MDAASSDAESKSEIGNGIDRKVSSIEANITTKQSWHHHVRAVTISLIACLQVFHTGYCIGFTSPAVRDFTGPETKLNLTLDEISWFGSLLTIGAMVGSLVCGPLMERLGRLVTMKFNMILYISGWVFIFSHTTVALLYIGRLLTGLAYGITITVVPVYVGEVGPTVIRGLLGASINLFLAIGIMAGYAFGIVFRWPHLAEIGIICASISLILCSILPESPFWLVKKKNNYDAQKAFKHLLGSATPLNAIKLRIASIQESQLENEERFKMKDILNPLFYRPLVIVVVLNSSQQLSGINALMFYVHSIFHAANFDDENLPSIMLGSVQILGLFVSMFLMDKLGRRKLFLVSSVGCGFCFALLGVCMYFISTCKASLEAPTQNMSEDNFPGTSNTTHYAGLHVDINGQNDHFYHYDSNEAKCSFEVSAWIALISSVMFIVLFALGLGPVPFTAIGELIPLQRRDFAGGLATFSNNLFSFVVVKSFPLLSLYTSSHAVFWGFGVINFMIASYAWWKLPETKGRSLQEIQELFAESPQTYRVRDDSSGHIAKKTVEETMLAKSHKEDVLVVA
ncbi:unnamed protein product [Clavelina lepadiformis]|uniref:Major facilitator superfamily (MFS) profile domain-containing protein n=1 Tax=Clavelina lepadiformis TaxID=159417 RepID=A0ABP0F5R1_CLALP